MKFEIANGPIIKIFNDDGLYLGVLKIANGIIYFDGSDQELLIGMDDMQNILNAMKTMSDMKDQLS